MPLDVNKILKQTWERYDIPESYVSGEFPFEPMGETEVEDSGVETTTLSIESDEKGSELRMDLAISSGQGLEIASSEALAEQLSRELAHAEELELLAVEPRSYEEFPGVLQRMKLIETGEILLQWLIATPDDTIFAGVTFTDPRFEALGKKFFDSIVLSDE